MANRKNNKEQVNVEEVITQSEAFIIKYRKAIIGGVAVVTLATAGLLAYKHLYANPREEQAQAAFFRGEEYFRNEAYEQALNGDSLGYAGFLTVAEQYGGTKAANLAKAYAGLCYKHMKEYEKAIEYLSSFNGNDQMVAPGILGAIGNSYAELEQPEKAVAFLLKAANKADNNTLSPVFLRQAGQLLAQQGKYEDAVNVYTKIKDKYAQSYVALDIDKYIEQAKSARK
jgi:tetratricopeptide (TPR) repeat protein